MNIHFYLTVIVICNFTMDGTGLYVQFFGACEDDVFGSAEKPRKGIVFPE